MNKTMLFKCALCFALLMSSVTALANISDSLRIHYPYITDDAADDYSRSQVPLSEKWGERVVRAQLLPYRHTVLSTEISGKITHFHVQEGEPFKKDQLLFELDCQLHKTQHQQAVAQLDAARIIYRGNKQLAKTESVGKVTVASSWIDVEKAQTDLKYQETLLEKCKVEAPFDGRAGRRQASELAYVQTGEPIQEIIDNSAMKVEFIVPTHWLSLLPSGLRLKFVVEDTGKHYFIRVREHAAIADPVSQSVSIMARLEAVHSELIPGMSGIIYPEFITRHSMADELD